LSNERGASVLNLPKSTEFDKKVPKQKFYDKIEISPEVKRALVEQIKEIRWVNKLSPDTLNLQPGTKVTELEVFLIHLKEQELDERVLRQIDRELPYHLLFLLEYEKQYKAVIGYKEAAEAGTAAFKVNRYYATEWGSEAELRLELCGLDIDAVYENYVRQIAGTALTGTQGSDLRESVENAAQQEKLERQLAALDAKIRKEKQPKKKFELVQERKRLKSILEGEHLLGNVYRNNVTRCTTVTSERARRLQCKTGVGKGKKASNRGCEDTEGKVVKKESKTRAEEGNSNRRDLFSQGSKEDVGRIAGQDYEERIMTLIADEVLESSIITVFTAFEQLHSTLRKAVLEGFGIYEEEEAILPMQLLTADTIESVRSYENQEKESIVSVAKELIKMGWCPSVMWEISDVEDKESLTGITKQLLELSKKAGYGNLDQYIIDNLNKEVDRYAEEWKVLIKDEGKRECAISAISLYKEKKYTATGVLLFPLWEGIIKGIDPIRTQQLDAKYGSSSRYSKAKLMILIGEFINRCYWKEYEKVFTQFYRCKIVGGGGNNGLINRNEVAHGKIGNVFSEKQALNAILITNIIVHLMREE
jgi:hypothetical protein